MDYWLVGEDYKYKKYWLTTLFWYQVNLKDSKWENISVDELGGLYQVAIRKGWDQGLQISMHTFSRCISLDQGVKRNSH